MNRLNLLYAECELYLNSETCMLQFLSTSDVHSANTRAVCTCRRHTCIATGVVSHVIFMSLKTAFLFIKLAKLI